MRSSALLLLFVPLFTACASGGGPPPEALPWTPGQYVMEGAISNPGGGIGQRNEYRAELTIEDGGVMRMSSLAGLCQEPAAVNAGQDQARGQRTFTCGEETYRVRPGAGTVLGEVTAPIVEETVVTECVRYQANAQGVQVCVETRERVVRTTRQRRAQLAVRAGR